MDLTRSKPELAEAEPARWVEVMRYSHPTIIRRVAMARDFESENGAAAC